MDGGIVTADAPMVIMRDIIGIIIKATHRSRVRNSYGSVDDLHHDAAEGVYYDRAIVHYRVTVVAVLAEFGRNVVVLGGSWQFVANGDGLIIPI